MKFTFLTTVAIFAVPKVLANTPDLCTDDIPDLKRLKPSECDPTGRVGPDIPVGSTVYTNDEAHFVIGSPKMAAASGSSRTRTLKAAKKAKKGIAGPPDGSIIVYLPGKFIYLYDEAEVIPRPPPSIKAFAIILMQVGVLPLQTLLTTFFFNTFTNVQQNHIQGPPIGLPSLLACFNL